MRKNKNILKKGMILAAVSTMVVTMAPAIPAYAYGEADSKTGQAAFNAATTGSADYQSWLTGTWQGGTQDFANTNQIALTPGSTAKDLGFAWYSKTKGTPAGRWLFFLPTCRVSHQSYMRRHRSMEQTADRAFLGLRSHSCVLP